MSKPEIPKADGATARGETPKNAAADRTMSVLSAFRTADRALGVTELSSALDLDKSVVHRILATLVDHGFLERDDASRRYRVGLRCWELGQRYAAVRSLREAAEPPLKALVDEFDLTGYVARLDDVTIIYLDVVMSPGPLRVHVDLGDRAPAQTTALGKAMLACIPDEELTARLEAAAPLVGRTEASLRELREVVAEIQAVREQGYAVNRGEHSRGVGAVGAAIRDSNGRPFAAVSAAFPMLPDYDAMWTTLPDRMVRLAAEIETRLGIAQVGSVSP